MPGAYLPDEPPDVDDFFAEVVPTPPPTDRPGGMLFMAPFEPDQARWFAYARIGTQVDRFEGTLGSVTSWARTQDVTERWIYSTDGGCYVPWPGPASAGTGADRS